MANSNWMDMDETMDATLSTSSLRITNQILALIAEIDEFKGAWRAIGRIAPERHYWNVARTAGDHDNAAMPLAVCGRHAVFIVVPVHRRNRGMRLYRRL